MEFNADKCKVIRITNKHIITSQSYLMHNQTLEVVDSAKYLGVFTSTKNSHGISTLITLSRKLTKLDASFKETSDHDIQVQNCNVIKPMCGPFSSMDQ